jgi:hypothetical protein
MDALSHLRAVGLVGVGFEVDQDGMAKRHFSSFVVSRSRYLLRRRLVSALGRDGGAGTASPVGGCGLGVFRDITGVA